MDYFTIEIMIVKFWGYFFLAFSIPLLMSNEARKGLIEISKDKVFIYTSGFLSLMISIPLVLINNVWRADIVGLTTLMAWFGIIKGMIRLYKPQIVIDMSDKYNDKSMKVISWIVLLIGIGFTYAGYNPYWC